jgi:hypothetical protein
MEQPHSVGGVGRNVGRREHGGDCGNGCNKRAFFRENKRKYGLFWRFLCSVGIVGKVGIAELRAFCEAKYRALSGKGEKAREYGGLVRVGDLVLVGVFIFSMFAFNDLFFMSALL